MYNFSAKVYPEKELRTQVILWVFVPKREEMYVFYFFNSTYMPKSYKSLKAPVHHFLQDAEW